MLSQQTHRLQAQLCGQGEGRRGEGRASQVCTSLHPAQGLSRAITSEPEPRRSQEREEGDCVLRPAPLPPFPKSHPGEGL